jgi:hypothetical protein
MIITVYYYIKVKETQPNRRYYIRIFSMCIRCLIHSCVLFINYILCKTAREVFYKIKKKTITITRTFKKKTDLFRVIAKIQVYTTTIEIPILNISIYFIVHGV